MSQRTSNSDSAASAPTGINEAGLSLVPVDRDARLDAPILRIGPRTSQWLPDVNEILQPVVEKIVRELAWDFDPRILRDEVPRQFPRYLQRKLGVGSIQNSDKYVDETDTPIHPFVQSVSKLAISYGRVIVDDLSPPRKKIYERVEGDVIGAGTRDHALREHPSLSVPTGVDALRSTIIRLLEVGDYLPSITLVLDGDSWMDVPDKRTAAEALEAITALANVIDIRLVVSPRLDSHLTEEHPDWADLHLTQTSGDRRPRPPISGTESDQAVAWAAMGGFSDGGGRVRILNSLEPGSVREVRDLRYDDDIELADGSIDRYIRELADEHELLEIDDRRRFNRIWLTGAGVAAQALVTPNLRVRHPEQTRLENLDRRTRQSSTGIVYGSNLGTTPTPPDDRDSGDRDALGAAPTTPLEDQSSLSEAAQTAEEWFQDTGEAHEDGYTRWLGPVDGRFDQWEMHERQLAGRRTEGVTLVDDDIAHQDDGRVSTVSCFDDHVQVALQWGGPLPTLVRTTASLLSNEMWSKVLVPSALGGEFEHLFNGEFPDTITEVLRLGSQMGWLGDDISDYDDFKERYIHIRDYILSKLPEATAGNAIEWSELARDAHGLLASVTQLYNALGIDVTVNVRIPDTRKLRAGEARYNRFLNFMKHTVPKNAVYGVHSVPRLLYEDRPKNLKHRMRVEYGSNPSATLTASWVITGPTATTMLDDVRDAIASKTADIRETIQDGVEHGVGLHVPVVDGNTYAALQSVVRRHADRKGYDPSPERCREIIRLATATLGTEPGRCSPYSLCEALLAMEKALGPADSLTPDDVAYGLTQVPAHRLMPTLKTTMQKALKVLLSSDEPIGRSEIIKRAAISERSYDRNIQELAAVGMVESVGNGGHRKWKAWILPWWTPLVDIDGPRTSEIDESPATAPSRVDDVLYQVAIDLGLEHEYELFESPVSVDEVFDALPRLERWRYWFCLHYGLLDMQPDQEPPENQYVDLGVSEAGEHPDQASLESIG